MHEYLYALFSTLGYSAGALVFVLLTRKAHRSWNEIIPLLCVIITASLFGAKLFHVLFEAQGHGLPDGDVAEGVLDLLASDPWHWARLFSPGYVFYGGLLTALFAGGLYLWLSKTARPLQMADCAAPAVALGLCLGRIGCYLGGCCVGMLIGEYGRLPVQVIESAFAGLLFLFLITQKSVGKDGKLLWTFVFAYSAFRFAIEFVRADSERGFWFQQWLSTSQVIALCLLSLIALTWKRLNDNA